MIKHLQIGKKGRKTQGTTLLFIDFNGAFDQVDRLRLFHYLIEDFKGDPLALSTFAKLLWPSKVYLSDQIFFNCSKGDPQGMTTS